MCLYFLLPSSLKSIYCILLCLLVLISSCIIGIVLYVIHNSRPTIAIIGKEYEITIINTSCLPVTIQEVSFVNMLNGVEKEKISLSTNKMFPVKLNPDSHIVFKLPYSPNTVRIYITYKILLTFKVPFALK